ncbi:MAG: ribonuclease Z [Ruminococcaceae bacterium]|nr:ribonuclease Z [Oscillospiraceae bacterium]
MKLHFLGTCSGTEPMPGRNHVSWVLETGGFLYFFDAGEGCSKAAHLLGLDLLATKQIVISHPHMDHVGGLANLLWTIRKLMKRYHRPFVAPCLEVSVSAFDTWNGVMQILRNTEDNFENSYPIVSHGIAAGLLFDDGTVRVTAYPNTHIKPENGVFRSFSFLIECEGKRLVYSGDIKSYSELDSAIGEGCDVLIGETGHHKIDDVYAYTSQKQIGKVFFSHHGREILNDPIGAGQRVKELFGNGAVLCHDGMTVTL